MEDANERLIWILPRWTYHVATMVKNGATARFSLVGNEIGKDPSDATKIQTLGKFFDQMLLWIG